MKYCKICGRENCDRFEHKINDLSYFEHPDPIEAITKNHPGFCEACGKLMTDKHYSHCTNLDCPSKRSLIRRDIFPPKKKSPF